MIMKTLTSPKISISDDGKTVTIVADIVEKPFSTFFIQRSTVSHFNPQNIKHPRHILISNEGVFAFHHQHGFAFTLEDFAAIAAAVEPKTSFAPEFSKSDDPLSVNVISELPVTYQWQFTDRIKPVAVDAKSGKKPEAIVWTNISGANQKTLDKAAVKPALFVRCVVTNAVGSSNSNPFLLK